MSESAFGHRNVFAESLAQQLVRLVEIVTGLLSVLQERLELRLLVAGGDLLCELFALLIHVVPEVLQTFTVGNVIVPIDILVFTAPRQDRQGVFRFVERIA